MNDIKLGRKTNEEVHKGKTYLRTCYYLTVTRNGEKKHHIFSVNEIEELFTQMKELGVESYDL